MNTLATTPAPVAPSPVTRPGGRSAEAQAEIDRLKRANQQLAGDLYAATAANDALRAAIRTIEAATSSIEVRRPCWNALALGTEVAR